MTERDLIHYIKHLVGSEGNGLVQGIGDDCAVVTKDEQNVWLLTMDTLIESVHFDCSWHPPYLLGRKAVSVNVSDIAAMGGKPAFALLSLGLPVDFTSEWTTELTKGIYDACHQYGCLLVGGDTVCSPERVSLTITLIGEAAQGQVVYRSGAKVGDTIWVSGSLGYAAAGLDFFQSGKFNGMFSEYPLEVTPCIEAHLDPEARVGLGISLAQTGCVRAMMDLSDGIATDLSHLCQQSGVGALIEAEKLPGLDGLIPASDLLGKKSIDWTIAGGEDYELLFTTAPKDDQVVLAAASEQGIRVAPVGTIQEEGNGVTLRQKTVWGYEEQQILFQGFDHFTKS